MNITKFLSSGETTVVTKKLGVLRKAAAALIVPIAISCVIGACQQSSEPTLNAAQTESYQQISDLITANPLKAFADIHLADNGQPATYTVNAKSLFYQALVDPSLQRIRTSSSTSVLLDQFLASQPDALKAIKVNGPGSPAVSDLSAKEISEGIYNDSPGGKAFSLRSDGLPTACIVLATGLSREAHVEGQITEFVSYSDTLYTTSGDSHDVFATIHELTHCQKNENLFVDFKSSDRISPYYESSLREMRSDLAVVLYGASQTGSFDEGIALVTAFHGYTSGQPTHATVGMIEVITKGLDAKDFVGKPVHEIISAASTIVSKLSPATNAELRLAFAKDSWTYRTIGSRGGNGPNIRPANFAHAEFVGHPFEVNIAEYSAKVINRSLDHALSQADVIRSSKAMPLASVEAYAAQTGFTLTPEMVSKAKFVDAAFTPLGTTQSSDGSVHTKATTFTMKTLESNVQADLKAMVERGVVSAHETKTAEVKSEDVHAPQDQQTSQGLSERFSKAFASIISGLDGHQGSVDANINQEIRVRGPGM